MEMPFGVEPDIPSEAELPIRAVVASGLARESTQRATTVEHARSAQHMAARASVQRTIRAQGRGGERNLPVTRPDRHTSTVTRRRSALLDHRSGFQPDRLVMWAMVLGIALMFMALLSSAI